MCDSEHSLLLAGMYFEAFRATISQIPYAHIILGHKLSKVARRVFAIDPLKKAALATIIHRHLVQTLLTAT